MSTWPLHTRFFLNVWTSGYEPFLLAVAKHFKTPVHVDRWKYALFKSYMTQENLLQCFTLDSSSTRFHACQRQFKCDEVWNGGRGCFVFSSEEQQQIHRNSLKIKTASRKNKLNVGCGCLITSENCLGEGCSKEAEDEALLVYVNPAEPFEASRYDSYQQELHDRLEACQQEAFIRSITKKPYIEPLAWPNHLVSSVLLLKRRSLPVLSPCCKACPIQQTLDIARAAAFGCPISTSQSLPKHNQRSRSAHGLLPSGLHVQVVSTARSASAYH